MSNGAKTNTANTISIKQKLTPRTILLYVTYVALTVVSGGVFPQPGQIGAEELAQKSAQHHVTVQGHPDVINPNGQMAQYIIPEMHTVWVTLLHPGEKIGQRSDTRILDTAGRAVCLQAALPAAAAPQTSRLDTHMAELGAAPVVSVVRGTVQQDSPAYTVFQ